MDLDSKEQVGKINDIVTETIISPLQPTLIPSDEHPTTQEVIHKPHETVNSELHPISNVEILDMHELPPGSTIGVSQTRYDLKFEA